MSVNKSNWLKMKTRYMCWAFSLYFLPPLLWISSCRTAAFIFIVHYSPVMDGLTGVFCSSSVTASMCLNWKLRRFSTLVSVHIYLIMPDWAAGHFAKVQRPQPTHFLLFIFRSIPSHGYLLIFYFNYGVFFLLSIEWFEVTFSLCDFSRIMSIKNRFLCSRKKQPIVWGSVAFQKQQFDC